MAKSPTPEQEKARTVRVRSLAYKFSVFTGFLVAWVASTVLVLDARPDAFEFKNILILSSVLLVSLAVARFSIRVLASPISRLQKGIEAVRSGRLEPIPVSHSGDEIEYLGESFNQMISALAASREELRSYSESLEQRISQRTEDLDRAVKQATAASQAKSEFLANVSHELRTPMNGVIGMIEMVIDGRLTLEQRDQLETALRCAYSLLALVNDILDVTRMEAGKMVLERIPFDVRKLISDCVESHRPAARAKEIAISWTVDSGVPERVTGDRLRIRQMVLNLLSNGVKFTDRGEVRLAVTAESASARTLELRISVADTGAGITAEMVPTLFQPFTQADATISRKHGGTGLGLSITRRLAEMHGGGVQVESQEGKGSTFRISLQCECSSPEVPAYTAASGVRVLVAEDNLINQRVVTAILRKKGYEPIVANNGCEALEQLRGAPTPDYFAIVLMDVQMPMMDGLQATRAIRGEARWMHLPIVAMTAHAMVGDRDRCLQAGMNGYISKPLNPAHLISTVERYVGQGDRSERAAAAVRIDAEPQRRAPMMVAGSEAALAEGMVQVFLQLAPERLERLVAAARRGDTEKLMDESQRIASAAQRIAAGGVSECTREITRAATEGDYDRVHEELARLSDQIAALQNTVPRE